MKNYLNSNLKILTNKNHLLAEKIKNFTCTTNSIKIEENKNGELIPFRIINEKKRYYHSKFNAERSATRVYETEKTEGCKVFFGCGFLYDVRPFLEGDNTIIIIEPDLELLSILFSLFNLIKVLEYKKIHILTGNNTSDIVDVIKSIWNPILSGNLSIIKNDLSTVIYANFFSQLSLEINNYINNMKSDISTQAEMSKRWIRNSLLNYMNISNMLDPPNWAGKNVLLCGAGPSLTDNLNSISNYEDYLIVAVDSALPILEKHKLHVEGVVSLDPQIITYLHFLSPKNRDFILFSPITANPISTRDISKVCYYQDNNPIWGLLNNFIKAPIVLEKPISQVTEAAFLVLEKLNPANVTIIGADYCFIDKKPYANGGYFEEFWLNHSNRFNPLESSLTKYVLKKDINSNGRYSSDILLQSYKDSFTKTLQNTSVSTIWKKPTGATKSIQKAQEIVLTNRASFRKNLLQNISNTLVNMSKIDIKDDPLLHLTSCNSEEKKIWLFLLPVAYRYLRNEENNIKCLNSALSWFKSFVSSLSKA